MLVSGSAPVFEMIGIKRPLRIHQYNIPYRTIDPPQMDTSVGGGLVEFNPG